MRILPSIAILKAVKAVFLIYLLVLSGKTSEGEKIVTASSDDQNCLLLPSQTAATCDLPSRETGGWVDCTTSAGHTVRIPDSSIHDYPGQLRVPCSTEEGEGAALLQHVPGEAMRVLMIDKINGPTAFCSGDGDVTAYVFPKKESPFLQHFLDGSRYTILQGMQREFDETTKKLRTQIAELKALDGRLSLTSIGNTAQWVETLNNETTYSSG